MRILEIGCGDGTLWVDNIGQLAMTGKRNEFSGKKKHIYRAYGYIRRHDK